MHIPPANKLAQPPNCVNRPQNFNDVRLNFTSERLNTEVLFQNIDDTVFLTRRSCAESAAAPLKRRWAIIGGRCTSGSAIDDTAVTLCGKWIILASAPADVSRDKPGSSTGLSDMIQQAA